ncbi:MAG: hypothetical protein AB7G11_00830 [Phycisphaerales bacterium]
MRRGEIAWMVWGVCVAGVVGIIAVQGTAQTLNLGPGDAMPSGQRLMLERAITTVETELNGLGEVGTDGTTPWRKRYREFAGALLRRGLELNERGARHVVAGMTLMRGRGEFDSLASRALGAAADVRRQFDAAVMRLPTKAANVPGEGPGFDSAVADLLWPIVVADVRAGGAGAGDSWVRNEPAVEARREVEGVDGAPDDLVRALHAVEQSAAEADAPPWMMGKARSVRLALRAFEELPGWIPPARREALRRAAREAIEQACGDVRGPYDAEALCRAGMIAALAWSVNDRRELPARVSKEVRELVVQVIGGEGGKRAGPLPREGEAMVLLLRALQATGGAGAGAARIPEGALVREVRPAYRLAARDREAAAETVVTASVESAKRGFGASDPGFAAAMNAYTSAERDVQLMIMISEWLAEPMPADAPASASPHVADDPIRKKAAARVLRIGQAMIKVERRAGALEALRPLAHVLPPSDPESAEWQVRASRGDDALMKAWNIASADQVGSVLGVMDTIRTELARRFGEHAGDPLDAEGAQTLLSSLAVAERIVERVRSAARVGEMAGAAGFPESRSGSAGIEYWPAWELPAADVRALAEGAPDLLGRACEALVARNDAQAVELLDRFDREYASVRLVDQLQQGARIGGEFATAGYRELATAPVIFDGPIATASLGSVWLVDQRDDLARLCWMAGEYGAALEAAQRASGAAQDDARKSAESLRAYVNAAANDIVPSVRTEHVSRQPWCPQQPPR